MEWITPKTDWAARTDADGNYTGDYFNVADYNRIKNNIEYLGAMARKLWPVLVRAMPDRRFEEYPYADEINTLADNLEAINAYVGGEIGEKTVYAANGAFIGFKDLNRIESACMDLYETMCTLYKKDNRLPFRFGGSYYPHKMPRILKVEARRRLAFRLGSDYFP